MQVFFDTEFTGLHHNTTLISIGLVSENNKTFYAELTDYDKTQLDDWLNKNVIDNLMFNSMPDTGIVLNNSMSEYRIKDNSNSVKEHLTKWLTHFNEQIEMWSDCLSYDWVLFNKLYGHAFNIPKFVYYIPYDICTMFKLNGIDPDINREEFAHWCDVSGNISKHNALHDARVIKACYDRMFNEEIYGYDFSSR